MKFIPAYLARQRACPAGFVGRRLAQKWETSKVNRRCNAWAVDLLDLRTDDQVLEIGFGTGYALELIAQQIPQGSLVGIDHSRLMFHQASARLQNYKQELPLALITAAIEDPPRLGHQFNRVLAVNSLIYWPDKEGCLRRLRGQMQPDGKLVLVHRPFGWGFTEKTVRRAGRGLTKLLELTGFQEVRSEFNPQIGAVAVWGYS